MWIPHYFLPNGKYGWGWGGRGAAMAMPWNKYGGGGVGGFGGIAPKIARSRLISHGIACQMRTKTERKLRN